MNSPPKNVRDAFAQYYEAVDDWKEKYENIQFAMKEATVKDEFEILQEILETKFKEVEVSYGLALKLGCKMDNHPNKRMRKAFNKKVFEIGDSLWEVGQEYFDIMRKFQALINGLKIVQVEAQA